MSEMQETQISEIDDSPEWLMAKRISFRFAFVYLMLYGFPFLFFPLAVISQLSGLLPQVFDLWQTGVSQPVVSWVGRHVLASVMTSRSQRSAAGIRLITGFKYSAFYYWRPL